MRKKQIDSQSATTQKKLSPNQDITPPSWRRLTSAYFAAFTLLGLVLASLGPTLPGLAEQTGTRIGAVGFLFTARALGGFSGALLSGRLYDKQRGHMILVATLALMALMLALTPFSSQLWVLTIVLFLLGIGEGTLDVGVNTLIVWVHGEKVGPFMNALHFFFGVGAFFTPIIVAEVLRRTGQVGGAYWILSLLIVPLLFWFWRLPSPNASAAATTSTRGPFDSRLVLLIAIFLALYVGAEITFGGWIFTYAITLDLANETGAAYLTSAFWGAFTVGRLLSIPLAVRLPPRAVLGLAVAGALASLAALLFRPTTIFTWAGTIGVGLALAPVFPTTLALAERRLAITGRVTSWFFVGASVGAMILPWLAGQLFDRVSPRIAMVTVVVDLVAAGIVLLAMLARSTPQEA